MSDFSRFMKKNKIVKPNEFYAPTKSLVDENGEPLKWEFKRIDSKQMDEIRDSCTIDVPVAGKPRQMRPKVKTSQLIVKTIAASTVYPDLMNAELQDSYGVKTPEDLIYAMVDDPGEYADFSAWISEYQGFTVDLDDEVEEAKN